MIAVDTNVLVHAHREESPKHRAAHARVVALAESPARWGIPVFCIGEFARVITHPRLFDPPYTAEEACEALARLLASPSVVVLCPGSGYPELLAEAIRESNAIGNLVFDAGSRRCAENAESPGSSPKIVISIDSRTCALNDSEHWEQSPLK